MELMQSTLCNGSHSVISVHDAPAPFAREHTDAMHVRPESHNPCTVQAAPSCGRRWHAAPPVSSGKQISGDTHAPAPPQPGTGGGSVDTSHIPHEGGPPSSGGGAAP